MADIKDKKIPEVPHLENVTGVEKIPVSAVGGVPRYIEVNQIVDKVDAPTLQSGAKGGEKNYIYSDPTIQGKGAIAAARYRANDKGRLTAQYKYWGDTDFNYNTEFPQATPTADGVMSAEDKKAIDKAVSDIDKAVSDIGNIATDLADLEFTVETLNEGLGHANNDIRELGDRIDSEFEDVIFGKEVVDETTMPELKTHTIDEVKKALFVDMWKAMYEGNDYNKTTDSFSIDYGNGTVVDNITYEEALLIQRYGTWGERTNLTCNQYSDTLRKNIKATIPTINGRPDLLFFDDDIFNHWIPESLTTIKYTRNKVGSTSLIFRFSKNREFISHGLVAIYDVISPTKEGLTLGYRAEGYNRSLTTLYIYTQYSLSLRYLQNLSIYTFRYLVDYAYNTSPITITVHPDVYAKLTDESNAEWYQVNQDAIAKQITFATA